MEARTIQTVMYGYFKFQGKKHVPDSPSNRIPCKDT